MDAVLLTVLDDAPAGRRPYVLHVARRLSVEEHDRVRRAWDEAFRRAGREAPVLVVLDADLGMTVVRRA